MAGSLILQLTGGTADVPTAALVLLRIHTSGIAAAVVVSEAPQQQLRLDYRLEKCCQGA